MELAVKKERRTMRQRQFPIFPLIAPFSFEKLTSDPAYKPEVVHDLKNIDEVFQHYQPEVEMEFETEEGPQRV